MFHTCAGASKAIGSQRIAVVWFQPNQAKENTPESPTKTENQFPDELLTLCSHLASCVGSRGLLRKLSLLVSCFLGCGNRAAGPEKSAAQC